jgi:hypothetical protein
MNGPEHFRAGERILEVVERSMATASQSTVEEIAKGAIASCALAQAHFMAAQVAVLAEQAQSQMHTTPDHWKAVLS